jgi:hypothetical protein
VKKLLILLFLASLSCYSQTPWQDSLSRWEKKESKKTYGWYDSLTEANKLQRLKDYYGLQIKARREAYLSRITDSVGVVNIQAGTRTSYINHLKSIGYVCDNSKADWRKAYNKPEWFGSNWQNKADEAWAGSTGLNDFLNFCKQYNY